MGGIGKTTLAKQIYRDADHSLRTHFDCVGWAFVGRRFQTRLVFEDILLSLGSHTREELRSYSDLALGEQLFNFLQPRKYLIVLDDVWNVDDWDCLNIAFPWSEKTGSEVLLTSRSLKVAQITTSRNGFLHQMSGLNQEQSSELLFMTASRTQSPDSKYMAELTEIAGDIARNCSGIPLAIKLMGGLLASKKPTPSEWKMIHQDMVSYQANSDGTVEQILNLAYASLPHYLTPCFLYLGIFPEGAEVEAESLYLLWLAEGLFIHHKDPSGKVSMMDVAEWYLYQLCIRNLVLVHKQEVPTGRWFKSCRVHDLICDLCSLKQVEGDFFVDIHFRRASDIKASPSSSPVSTPKVRRLALSFDIGRLDPHRGVLNKKHLQSVSISSAFRNLQQSSPESAGLWDLSRLRVIYLCNYKMLSLPRVKKDLIPWHLLGLMDLPEVLYDLSALKNLGVLHCSGFNFKMTSLPAGIGKLRRLRYLSLRNCSIESLPSTIGSLKNLETLDMRVCTRTKIISLPVELQQLISMKHLYLPCNFELQGGGKLRLNGLINLEILVNFDSTPCEVKDLSKLTKLQKLVATVCRDSKELAEVKNCIKTSSKSLLFSSLIVKRSGLYSMENHLVINDLLEFPNLIVLRIEGRIDKLPMKISHSLSKLSLSGSELDEDPMEKLEKLPNLLVLDLYNNAFVRKRMTCSVSGMPQLRRLSLINLKNLESLVVKKGGMPNLSTLVLDRCQSLKDPPEGLSFLTSLQEFKVLHMPPEFMDRVNLAREVLPLEQVTSMHVNKTQIPLF